MLVSLYYYQCCLAALFAVCVLCGSEEVHHAKSRMRKTSSFPQVSRKPNVVLILTDDQDVELGSLKFMPKTLRNIRDEGAEFRHAYVTTPMCCPSRSSLLTGMYVHNHHVFTNNDNCSSTQWQATHETRSFATYLSNAGYRTGYFGKYLNKYNGSYIPPGWREWGGLIMNSKYYNYSINMNGKKIKHGFDYHKDYYPDLIANDSIAFLRQSKKNNINKPVMLTMSFPSPHGPEDSAPQYSHLFFNVTTHHTPSYDFAPNPDKQWILQITNKMKPIHREFTDLLMTKRLQTLQSVDAAVQRVVQELDTLGELQNTFIIYTSDHGYHLGQFGLIKGKSFPFEFDVRVPFLVRGPGVEAGMVIDDIVLNIDLAPTFLDIAGVPAPLHMDGRSVLPLFLNSKRRRAKWPDTFLIESSGRRETADSKSKAYKYSSIANNATNDAFTTTETPVYSSTSSAYSGNTTHKDIYESGEDHSEDDEEEDEDADEEIDEGQPAEVQLDNQLLPQPGIIATKSQRIAMECLHEDMQPPCKFGQKWFCQKENGRWRKHKCKQFTSTERAYKKCACMTKNGLIYKKIPINDTVSKKSRNRNKRDFFINEKIVSVRRELLRTVRRKRDTGDTLSHVENVMENIQSKLSGLEAANKSLPEEKHIKVNLETNRISETIPGCDVMSNGHINCSSVIYKDKKAWRQSRTKLDHEIQRLKQKLEHLKEIRRHLKYSKPIVDPNDFNATTERVELGTVNNNLDRFDSKFVNIPEFSAEKFDIFDLSRTPRRRKKLQDPEITHKNRKNFNQQSIAVSVPKNHSNHHRHRHQHPSSSTEAAATSVSVEAIFASTSDEFAESTTQNGEVINRDNDDDTEYCHCETEEPNKPDGRDAFREERRRLKEERLKKKARKLRKKAQLEKECLSEKIHCFRHDNDHWRTAPLWTSGPFCFCMNANNNTYNCLRTINSTHNLLYCEFVTGLVTFYNLRIDPFELRNRVDQLRPEERRYLHDQLRDLISCRGKSCTVGVASNNMVKHKPGNIPSMASYSSHRRRKPDQLEQEVARTLPLIHSAQSRSHSARNSRLIKLPKPWRRTKQWRSNGQSADHHKRQFLNGSVRSKW